MFAHPEKSHFQSRARFLTLRAACANVSEGRPKAFGPTPTEGLRPASRRTS